MLSKMDAKLIYFMLLSVVALSRSQSDSQKVLQKFASASNTFGVNLYRTMTLTSGGNKNSFFSPLSIYTAFAMVNAGARGHTSYELQKVLNWNSFASPSDILDGNNKIKIFIKSLSGSSSNASVSFANKLWLQRGFCTSVCKNYIKLLQTNYYSDLGIVNFARSPEVSRSLINKWVAGKTADKIEELLEPGTVRSTTTLVLTNAVYFKRNWKYQFDKDATVLAQFHVSKNSVVDATMMKMTSVVPYTIDGDNLAIELPYTTEEISMIVVLPRQRYGIKKLEETFNDAMLRKYMKNFRKTKVDISLPKFKIKSDIHLKDHLSVMGVRDLFDPFKSDLSGVTGYRGMFITHAIHQGFVDVNEEGTEAAAATGVVSNFRSLFPPTYEFNANHPFVFAIIHKPTTAILFQGEIADPTKELASSHS